MYRSGIDFQVLWHNKRSILITKTFVLRDNKKLLLTWHKDNPMLTCVCSSHDVRWDHRHSACHSCSNHLLCMSHKLPCVLSIQTINTRKCSWAFQRFHTSFMFVVVQQLTPISQLKGLKTQLNSDSCQVGLEWVRAEVQAGELADVLFMICGFLRRRGSFRLWCNRKSAR